MTALALPALIGGTGLGVEVSYWYLTQRSMQNAADSAAIAAATNGTANYAAEAKAAAGEIRLCGRHKQHHCHRVEYCTLPLRWRQLLQRDDDRLCPVVPVSGGRLQGHGDRRRQAADETQCDRCCASRPDAEGILHLGARDQRHRLRHERRSEGGAEGLQHHVERRRPLQRQQSGRRLRRCRGHE